MRINSFGDDFPGLELVGPAPEHLNAVFRGLQQNFGQIWRPNVLSPTCYNCRSVIVSQLLYHRTCKPDFLCSWPSLNSYLK